MTIADRKPPALAVGRMSNYVWAIHLLAVDTVSAVMYS